MRARHELSRSLPAHAHLARCSCRGIRQRMDSGRAEDADRRAGVAVPRGLRRLLRRRSPMRHSPALRDSNPSVVVIPGLGLFGFAKDKREARITTEFFVNAIHVMAGANALEGDRRRTPDRCRRPSVPEQARTSRASTTTWRCRGSRRSASSTGRSKKPSSSGCRRNVNSAARSRWSSAAAAASAARSSLQLARRGAHVVVADLNQQAAEDAAQEAAKAVVGRDGAGASRSIWASRAQHPRRDQGAPS